MWHVKDVGDVILIFVECNGIYVEDVKDRLNTPKGCNAMYVEDVKDEKRALCMSKMSEHTHTFLLIAFLIFNQFSIHKKFWKAET